MVEEIEMTKQEKVKMYMKCSKKELISMLLENQRLLKHFIPKVDLNVCNYYNPNTQSTAMECLDCGKGKYQH